MLGFVVSACKKDNAYESVPFNSNTSVESEFSVSTDVSAEEKSELLIDISNNNLEYIYEGYYENDDFSLSFNTVNLSYGNSPDSVITYSCNRLSDEEVSNEYERVRDLLLSEIGPEFADWIDYWGGFWRTINTEDELFLWSAPFINVRTVDASDIFEFSVLENIGYELSDTAILYDYYYVPDDFDTTIANSSYYVGTCLRSSVDNIPVGTPFFYFDNRVGRSQWNDCSIHNSTTYLFETNGGFVEFSIPMINNLSVIEESDVVSLEDCLENSLPAFESEFQKHPDQQHITFNVYAAELVYLVFYDTHEVNYVDETVDGYLVPLWIAYWNSGTIGENAGRGGVMFDATNGEIINLLE